MFARVTVLRPSPARGRDVPLAAAGDQSARGPAPTVGYRRVIFHRPHVVGDSLQGYQGLSDMTIPIDLSGVNLLQRH